MWWCTLKKGTDFPPACHATLTGVLAQGRLQKEERNAAGGQEHHIGNEENSFKTTEILWIQMLSRNNLALMMTSVIFEVYLLRFCSKGTETSRRFPDQQYVPRQPRWNLFYWTTGLSEVWVESQSSSYWFVWDPFTESACQHLMPLLVQSSQSQVRAQATSVV